MSNIEVGIVRITCTANSATVSHDQYNASGKEIKYITFSYVPYNAVNDTVTCTASGKCEARGEVTGPISPKYKGSIKWERMWFNPTVTKAVITQIHIQYMDNTEEVIEGKDLMSMNDPQSEYYKKEEERKKREEERKKREEERRKKEWEELEKRQEERLKKHEEENKEEMKRNIIIGIIVGIVFIVGYFFFNQCLFLLS